MTIWYGLLIWMITGFFNLALATDSTSPTLVPTTPLNPMTLATMTGQIKITVTAPTICGQAGTPNVYTFGAVCPSSSTYVTPTVPFSGDNAKNCLSNYFNCPQGMSVSNQYYGNCASYAFWPGTFVTTITCGLALQGWFPSTTIQSFLINNQPAGPVNSFTFGTYNVSMNCNTVTCWCSSLTGKDNGVIPSYGTL